MGKFTMFKVLIQGCCMIAATLLMMSSSSNAAPQTYSFDSGEVSIRVTRVDNGLSVIQPGDPDPFNILLDGSSVTFDPTLGTNGTILSLQLTAAGPIDISLDTTQSGITTEMLTIVNAVLASVGTGNRDLGNAFFIGTEMTADVSGTLADGFSSPFGPISFTSAPGSSASGTLFVSGNTLNLGISAVNLAIFSQVDLGGGTPPPDLFVKADFSFIGTLVPEPGTALLLGMGLIGLGCAERKK